MSDKKLLKTLIKRGPKEFKKDYDDYLFDRYVKTEDGSDPSTLGTAYAAGQSALADFLIPESPEEAAIAMAPVGRIVRAGKSLVKDAKMLRKLESQVPKSANTFKKKFERGVGLDVREQQLMDDLAEQFPDVLEEAQKAGVHTEALEQIQAMGARNPDLMYKLSNPDNNYKLLKQIGLRQDPAEQIKLINQLEEGVVKDRDFNKVYGPK